jgi:hypothetical protein
MQVRFSIRQCVMHRQAVDRKGRLMFAVWTIQSAIGWPQWTDASRGPGVYSKQDMRILRPVLQAYDLGRAHPLRRYTTSKALHELSPFRVTSRTYLQTRPERFSTFARCVTASGVCAHSFRSACYISEYFVRVRWCDSISNLHAETGCSKA